MLELVVVPPKTGNLFSCASEFARKNSILGALQRFGTKGVAGLSPIR